uniref:Zinc finger protein 660-like isoform X2 n=1 Tax=Petromyzon marinus TaxID=7757 RepID=A0AAJ7XKF5_PETMA|nr:zinc finger protein 660-like isoform X2 [Petromyzon marinus]
MSEAAMAESSGAWKSASGKADNSGGGSCLRWNYNKGRHEGPKAGKRWSAQRKAAAAAADDAAAAAAAAAVTATTVAAAATAAGLPGTRGESPVASALLVETESVKTEWECVYSNPEDLDVRRSHRHRKVKLPVDLGVLQSQRKKRESKKMKENIKITLKMNKPGGNDATDAHVLTKHPGSLKPYVCQECGKEFRQSTDLFRHQTLHTGERPLKCGACGKAFALQADLNRHAIIHTEQRPYACQECGKAFRWSQSLVHHRRSHSDVREFRCDACGKDFKHRRTLVQHCKTNCAGAIAADADDADDADADADGADDDGQQLQQRQEQQRQQQGGSGVHQALDEEEDEEEEDEEEEDEEEEEERSQDSVRTNLQLQQQQQTPSDDFQIISSEPPKRKGIAVHRSQPRGPTSALKKFLCQDCGKGFRQATDLVRHRSLHTGERNALCGVCGKGFALASDLARHGRTHDPSGERYPCSQCGKLFGCRRSALLHESAHSRPPGPRSRRGGGGGGGGGGRRRQLQEEEGKRRLARAAKRDAATNSAVAAATAALRLQPA